MSMAIRFCPHCGSSPLPRTGIVGCGCGMYTCDTCGGKFKIQEDEEKEELWPGAKGK